MSLINEVHDSLPCMLPLSTNYHIPTILIPTRHRRRALSHRASKSPTAHQRRARPRTHFHTPPIYPRQSRIQILPLYPTRTRAQSHGCSPHGRHRPNPLRSPRTTNSEFRHGAPKPARVARDSAKGIYVQLTSDQATRESRAAGGARQERVVDWKLPVGGDPAWYGEGIGGY
jgi:hypothetical protein